MFRHCNINCSAWNQCGELAGVEMIGLIFLGMFAVCAVAAIFIARAGARMGEKQWGGWKGKLAGGTLAILLASLPMTWDSIPTIISYRKQCQTAGLQVFKDVERWRSENPGEDQKIASTSAQYKDRRERTSNGGTRTQLNSRFVYEIKNIFLGYVVASDAEVIDLQKQEVLARHRMVSTGKGELKLHDRIYGLDGFKFWLNLGSCGSVAKGQMSIFGVINSFKNIGATK